MKNPTGLTTWNSNNWRPLTDLRREMDRLFDDFWSPSVNKDGRSEAQFVPACDVEEGDEHYLLSVEMPGISKDDIRIEVIDSQLTVSGERKHEKQTKEEGAWYSERRYGKFQRSFNLPAGINADRIEADYQDGVLRLMVPKAEAAKPRQIKIGSGGGSGLFRKFLGQKEEKEVRSTSENVNRSA